MVVAAAILQFLVLAADGSHMTQDTGETLVERPQAPRPKQWLPHAVWAGIIVIPFFLWLAALSQKELPEGTCSGIGWGCELAGWDAVGITLIFVGVPLLFVLLVGHLIIGLSQWIRSRRTSAS